MKKHKAKRDGLGLEFKTFKGQSGKSYLVFRTLKGSYHVFVETEAKEAARDCGAGSGTSREQWKSLWDAYQMVKKREPVIPSTPKPTVSILERLRANKVAASKR